LKEHVQRASKYWQTNLPFFHGVNQEAGPSAYFQKHFTQGVCYFGGHVSIREPRYKDRSMIDPSVLLWMSTRGMKWEHKYAMAVPTPDTGYKSLCKYEKVQPVIDEEIWDMACQMTEDHYRPYMCNSKVITLDAAEAECNKQTSNGYPITLKYPVKENWLYEDGSLREEYRTIQRKYFEDIATVEGARTFFTASQKYEMRLRTKLLEGKIRTFTASSVTHNLAMSQLCHDMNQKFYASHGKTMSCVGMSKYYGNWHSMITDLMQFTFGWALDESDYDSSFFRRQLWAQMRMRFRFLSREFQTIENWNRLVHLYFDIIYTIMVTPQGDVIVKNTGNPSGQNCTIVDNTIGLTRFLYYAFIKLWRQYFIADFDREKEIQRELVSLSYVDDSQEQDLLEELQMIDDRRCTAANFHKHVCAKLCGDDNTFSVADSWLSWFNGKNIAEVWTSLGVKTKSDDWEPRKVVDLDFLSQTTKWFPDLGRYLPVPEMEKTMDSLLFGSTSVDPRWSLLRAFALRLESWPNEGARELIWDYISYMWANNKDKLVGSVKIPTGGTITYDNILHSFMSDRDIANLYCGFETSSMRVVYDMLRVVIYQNHEITMI